FAYEHIKKKYPDSTYVFIFRDPRDNIRSILNRLKLKGDLDNLNIDKLDIIDPWKEILKSKNVGVKTNHYIKNLSHRWNIAFNNCYNNDKNIIIVKYEDFLKNKVGFIKDLCDKTKLKYKTDITNFTEIQYQPKGDGNASWVNFFGEANLRNINTICSDGIKHLEYDK
ncbi:MAG: sulfotransferase, partial [Bacteroidales bacterium]|nr:sulfotransferase [Bacteroidales bacterium]